MQSLIDTRTLLFVITIILICRAAIMGYVWIITKHYQPVKYWLLGSTMMACGSLLVGLRDIAPLFVSVFIGQVLLILGWMVIDGGIVLAAHRRPPWKAGIVVAVAAIAGTYWFLLVTADFGLRTVATTLPGILFDTYAGIACLLARVRYRTTTLRILSGLLLGLAASNLWKTSFILGTGTQVLFAADWPIIQFYLLSVISTVTGTVLFVLLATQRLQEHLDRELEDHRQAEDRLREAENQLRLLLDSTAEAIYGIDLDGKCTFCNPACVRMLGYENPDQLRGRNMHDLIHYRHADGTRFPAEDCRIFQAFQTETGTHVDDEVLWRADGTSFPAEYWSFPQHIKGKVVGAVVTFVDITERKLAESATRQSIDEQTAIFESATSGIAFIKNRVIVKGNRTLDRLFGYAPGEQVGLTTRRWYADDKAYEIGGEPYAALARGETHQREQELQRKDGTTFWCRLSGSAIDSSDLSRGTVWMITDVTREHETVEEIQKAKDAAEVANLAKSRFLATMSHEIRTPMNGILGMAQMLLSPKLDDSTRQHYARTVLNSGQTLLTLLNDILDLSKVEAGKIELEAASFAPQQVIQETRTLFAEAAANKGLAIAAGDFQPSSQRYLGDAYRLRQMLSNLTNNAIKFTKQGQINIAAREIERVGQSAILEFSVTDTGIGIPENKRHLLFQPFSQTDTSTTRQYGGSGLGLSIVSSLAKLMGGEVGADSQPERGSRFWFRVHVRLLEAGQDSRHGTRPQQFVSTHPSSHLTGRVLVAEDNATNRIVAQGLLTQIGLTVVFAEDGQQALDAIVGGDPADLVLMDVHMPNMGGYTATEKIRQWEAASGGKRRPIVALTADAFESDRQKCLAAGMDDFIAKPIAIGTLREVLGRWLPADSADTPEDTEPLMGQRTLEIDRVVETLKELEPLLEHHHFDAILRFKSLQELTAGTPIAAEIEVAARLVAEFRFHEALDHLRRLAAIHAWAVGS